MKSITPVLLAGGSGTRLWPLSRKSYPKQFSQIIGNISLFQDSALRLTSSKKIKFGSLIKALAIATLCFSPPDS